MSLTLGAVKITSLFNSFRCRQFLLAVLSLVCALFMSLHAFAQPRWYSIEDPIFTNYSADEGLPVGRVTDIAEDSLGFIWMITTEGLVRWDGVTFQRHRDVLAGQDAYATHLQRDSQGWFWIGTERGLLKFSPITLEVVPVPLPFPKSVGILSISIVTEDAEDAVWLGTLEGVFKVQSSSGKVTHYLKDLAARETTLRVFSVASSTNGKVWAATSQGLYSLDRGDTQFSRVSLQPYLPDDTRISSILETEAGELWIGTPHDGLLVLDVKSQLVRPRLEKLSGDWIYAMEEIRSGVVWLGTFGEGILEVDYQNSRSRRLAHRQQLKFSLGSNSVWDLYRDSSGLVWAGTERGLSLHNPIQEAVSSVFSGTGGEGRLRGTAVRSLLETSDGMVWVGLDAGGIDIFNPTQGMHASVESDSEPGEKRMPPGPIETLVEVDSGDVLIGTNWGAYRHSGGNIQNLLSESENERSYIGVMELQGGRLWAGGTDGLWQASLDGQISSLQQVEDSVSGSFTDPRITALEGISGGIVVGTWAGVNWIDSNGSLLARLPQASASESAIPGVFISAFGHDQLGRLWVATSGSGIYISREPEGRDDFLRLNREHGLPSDIVASMQLDEQGRMWVASNEGLSVVDTTTLEVTNLDRQDGAVIRPYYRKASVRTRGGELLFGGDGGVTIVRPDQWQPTRTSSRLVVSLTQQGDHALYQPLDAVSGENAISIQPEANSFSVTLSALDYLGAEFVRYRYRLKGLEKQWHETDVSNRSLSYNQLPPGYYTLEVEHSNRYGQWSASEPMAVGVQVLPWWYQTLSVRVLFVILAALCFVALVRWRTWQLEQSQAQLEHLVSERTIELTFIADELRTKSEELEKVSQTDTLTGASSRRFFEQRIEDDAALSLRRHKSGETENADLIFFLLDIDHFKQVNDHFGHDVGDTVLVEMVRRMEKVARETDYLVRWGGEEFLLIARETTRKSASILAERIRNEVVRTQFDIGAQGTIAVSCSVGYCCFPFYQESTAVVGWRDCLKLADMSLYTAKRAGRNAWVGVEAGDHLGSMALVESILHDPAAVLDRGSLSLASNLGSELVAKAWLDGPAEE